VSLANLDEYDYANTGRSLRKLASEYFAMFEKENGKGAVKAAKTAKTGKAGKKK
jgi:aspartate 4-decarboxylase